jgi:exopolysaccharide biosynthesis polyprenyl glycosylphosphotransferase
MLREDKRLLDDLYIGISGCLIIAAYAALYALMRDHQPPLKPFSSYLPAIGILILVITATLSYRKLSAIGPLAVPLRLWRELAIAYFLAIVAYGFLAYTFKLAHLSRLYIYGGLLGSYALTGAWHWAAYAWHRRSSRGRELRRVLLVGDPRTSDGVARMFGERPDLGLEPAGVVAPGPQSVVEICRALDSSVVDCVFFSGQPGEPGMIEEAISCCQQRGVEVWFKMELARQELSFSRIDYLDDLPVLVFSLTPRKGAGILVKRALDVVLSLLLCAALAPLMLLLALAVRLSSPGPALFRQRRIGLNGREFIIYKFRSMSADPGFAPALQNEMSGPVFKMKEDPRTTALGRFMRRFSLDELPQLWNVLKGDMSLVGPRPPLPSEVDQYQDWQRRRLSMRPGITGLWQVMGRNDIADFNDWVKLDLRYLDAWSLWLDLKIILKTIPVVLRGTGL